MSEIEKKRVMRDLANILSEEWFEEIGEPTGESLDNMPENISAGEKGETSLYEGNSFFGPFMITLYPDMDGNGYYIVRHFTEPIGDYGTSHYYQWYQSKIGFKNDIEQALNESEDK